MFVSYLPSIAMYECEYFDPLKSMTALLLPLMIYGQLTLMISVGSFSSSDAVKFDNEE